MANWSSLPFASMTESALFQVSEALAANWSKSVPEASARRFFKAPSVLTPERATFTSNSSEAFGSKSK